MNPLSHISGTEKIGKPSEVVKIPADITGSVSVQNGEGTLIYAFDDGKLTSITVKCIPSWY